MAELGGDWSIASEMVLKDTLSKASSMSRKVPSTSPFLAMTLAKTLWSAVSVDVPFLKPCCFLLRMSSIPRFKVMLHVPQYDLLLEFKEGGR